MGFGLFLGSIPVYGLHLPLCLAVSLPLRLDAPVAYVAANISNPLVAPWLVLLEVQVGAYILTGQRAPFDIEIARQVGIGGFASYAAIGALIVGATLGFVGGAIAWMSVYAIKSRRNRTTT